MNSDATPSGRTPPATTLRRILGPVSVACVGVGAAIGSGIFATPGEAATHLSSPWIILVAWLVAGLITLLQSLLTAELATRMPRAGGEYQYLREAYGDFAAFFFGWSFTLFIIGAGSGTIAALFGDFAAQLLRLNQPWAAPTLGCAAVIGVVVVNVMGLRTGTITQVVLTSLKTASLVMIALGAFVAGKRITPVAATGPAIAVGESPVGAFFLALLPVFWSYTGATDSAKMAEETRDARRALPRALCGATLVLTAVYGLYNYALLCAASPADMAGRRSVPAMIFERAGMTGVGDLLLAASAVVCLGAISSTILANVRVTYAMGRDGLAPAIFSRMSDRQAPIASLLLGGVLACSFVVNRSFEQILRIYFMASTVLFGLTYLSLIVFRIRDRSSGAGFSADAYRLPLGILVAGLLVLLEVALAINIVAADVRTGGRDSIYTLALLGLMATLYLLWRAMHPRKDCR